MCFMLCILVQQLKKQQTRYHIHQEENEKKFNEYGKQNQQKWILSVLNGTNTHTQTVFVFRKKDDIVEKSWNNFYNFK